MRTTAASGALAALLLLSSGAAAFGQEPPEDPAAHSDVAQGAPAPPELPARAYVLADLGSGAVLVAKDPHGRHAPASTLKLLTAQTLLPTLDENAQVTAVDDDVRVDGTQIGLVPGSGYTVRQLSEAMLMGSGNDASEALARTAGGSDGVAGAVRAMNERAAALGARDTVARTPHGLDEEGQYSSAYDLVTILRGALDTPHVAPLLTVRSVAFPGGSKGGSFEVATQNKLLQFYDGAIGGKDGFTDDARHTYVGAVRRADRTYAVAWLGASSGDWRPSGALLDWAFAHGDQARPIEQLPPTASESADGSPADQAAGGSLVGSILLTALRVLGGTVLALAAAAVLLRFRKLRRDARRRAERAARASQAHGAARASHVETTRRGAVLVDATRRSPASNDPESACVHPSLVSPTRGPDRSHRGAPRARRAQHDYADYPHPAAFAPGSSRPARSKPRSTRQGSPGASTDSVNPSTTNSAV